MYPVGCVRHHAEGGALKVEISIQCLIDQIAAQARIPIKEYKHRVEGGVLIIEVVPDVESILNTVLSR
jgi:hypothetical protein